MVDDDPFEIPANKAAKRLFREYGNLLRSPIDGCTAAPVSDNDVFQWNGTVTGPRDTPYADGTFAFTVQVPDYYPGRAMEITLNTPIFHPNVSVDGELGFSEVLRAQWSPCVTMSHILLYLQAMLSGPNLEEECVVNCEAASLYLLDPGAFEERAREWTTCHAVRR